MSILFLKFVVSNKNEASSLLLKLSILLCQFICWNIADGLK